ncbi:MAG TPA: HXXEE domain-containing protein [Blastocatellia bacterium]|nr:HXXEE domain-containing protein [Blastocatellia bacterium]
MTKSARQANPVSNLPRAWPLLFPVTYLAHVAEEYWCGGGFYDWLSRFAGVNLTPERFLELNAYAWVVMLLISLLAIAISSMRWAVIPLATAVLVNGLAHAVGSIITLSYSPGLFTGLLLWVPLGAFTLRREYGVRSRKVYYAAIVFGLALHAAVTLAAFASS